MKKLIILLLLAFVLIGCEPNRNVDGYVMIKSIMYNDENIYYFDEEDYKWYDETFLPLYEYDYHYLYKKIDIAPFYELLEDDKVLVYGTGKNSVEIFVKASDIKSIKLEV